MGEKIIEKCIEDICTVEFWDECKEKVKAMFITACIMDEIEINQKKANEWLEEIFDYFDSYYDREAFYEIYLEYMKN